METKTTSFSEIVGGVIGIMVVFAVALWDLMVMGGRWLLGITDD